MANRANHPDSRDFIDRDEMDALFEDANPNPQRIGCPPREVLSALARRERAIEDPSYEHLTQCSPCYREFRALRQQTSQLPGPTARSSVQWFAAVAALLLLLAASAWLYFRSTGAPNAPVQPPVVAAIPLELDLRPFGVVRSEQPKGDLPPLALSASRLELILLLPTGSEPGAYEVRLLDASSRVLASASGQAEIRNFVTTLQAAIDLRSTPAGEYRLAVRREGEGWAFYRAVIR